MSQQYRIAPVVVTKDVVRIRSYGVTLSPSPGTLHVYFSLGEVDANGNFIEREQRDEPISFDSLSSELLAAIESTTVEALGMLASNGFIPAGTAEPIPAVVRAAEPEPVAEPEVEPR